MKRRDVIKTMSMLFASVLPASLRGSTDKSGTSRRLSGDQGVQVIGGGGVVLLPKSPKKGEIVHIFSDESCVKTPAMIKYEGTKIVGDKEDFLLDTKAQFLLTFKNQAEGWVFA